MAIYCWWRTARRVKRDAATTVKRACYRDVATGSAAAALAVLSAAADGASLAGHWDWASVSGTRTPPPPHHGQAILLGSPPRLEITWPLPRQGIHSRGSCDPSGRSSLSFSRAISR